MGTRGLVHYVKNPSIRYVNRSDDHSRFNTSTSLRLQCFPVSFLRAFATVVILLLPQFSAASETGSNNDAEARRILKTYCFQCHGPERQSADIRFDLLSTDLTNDRAAAESWHEALNSLDLGEMPPEDEARPSPQEHKTLTSWIRQKLEQAAAAQESTGGKVTLRRLNRYEYQNTMVDLLGIETDFATSLPPDTPSDEGFLNNGRSLLMSPLAFEYYLAAARRGLSQAIVTGPAPQVVRARITETDQPRVVSKKYDTATFSKQLGLNNKFVAKLDEYPITGAFVVRVTAHAKLIDDQPFPTLKAVFGYRADVHYPTGDLGVVDVTTEQPTVYEFRGRMEDFPVQDRGQGKFPGQLVVLTNEIDLGEWLEPDEPSEDTQRILQNEIPKIIVDAVEFVGPVFDTWPPKHHRQILFSSPLSEQSERGYVHEVVKSFMRRAYRRPIKDSEVESMLRVFDNVRPTSESFEDAIRETLALVLVSPDFLYLIEPQAPGIIEPQGPDGESQTLLTDYELASRLSYFLWSTMPDAELFELADSGVLREPDVLESQVERMLSDKRSWRFVQQFTDQWLDLGAVDRVAVNPQFYEDWDDELKPWMQQETRQFFGEILCEDLSALNLLDSDFAMLNAPLSRFYGIANGPRGTSYERVQLPPDSQRGGLLGHASMLLGNSTGEDSHPILRAVWIRQRLLNDPPASPPPNVPALDGENQDFHKLSIREQLEIHRKDLSCASCHQGIDPWGIALEHFDAVGLWRNTVKRFDESEELSIPVVAETTLPSGHAVSGADDLKTFLKKHRSDQFAKSLAAHLTSFAIGRSLEFSDEAELDELTDRFIESDYKLRALIHSIVSSDFFQKK